MCLHSFATTPRPFSQLNPQKNLMFSLILGRTLCCPSGELVTHLSCSDTLPYFWKKKKGSMPSWWYEATFDVLWFSTLFSTLLHVPSNFCHNFKARVATIVNIKILFDYHQINENLAWEADHDPSCSPTLRVHNTVCTCLMGSVKLVPNCKWVVRR